MHIIEIYLVKENVDNTNRYYLQGTMGNLPILYKSDKTNFYEYLKIAIEPRSNQNQIYDLQSLKDWQYIGTVVYNVIFIGEHIWQKRFGSLVLSKFVLK